MICNVDVMMMKSGVTVAKRIFYESHGSAELRGMLWKTMANVDWLTRAG